MIYLKRCEIENSTDKRDFPYSLPIFQNGFELNFNRDITVITGENGSGKSTLLENLAAKIGFSVYGGSCDQTTVKRYINNPNMYEDGMVDKQEKFADDISLREDMKLIWQMKTRKGYFLRAEYLEDGLYMLSDSRRYLSSSHGEAMLKLVASNRFKEGLFILDEPETALSPIRLLELMRLIVDGVKRFKAQYIIATHSPFLMALPECDLLEINQNKIERCALHETTHFSIMKRFFTSPQDFIDKYITNDE